MKAGLLLTVFVFLAGLLFDAQERHVELERRWPQVSAIKAAAGDGAGIDALSIALNGDEDCGGAMETRVKRFPNNLDLQIFHEVAADAACVETDAAFEIRLDLDLEAAPRFISVNKQIWQLEDGDGGGSYIELARFPLRVNAAQLRTEAGSGRHELRLLGVQTVGCPAPMLYTLRDRNPGLALDAFNALDAETVCPDAVIEIDETLALPATDMPADTLLTVNGYEITELESQSMSESDKVLTNISRVEVQLSGAEPARISLEIEGEHPDGCDYPALVNQTRAGNTVQIEIYRELPIDVICPMILRPYSGVIELDGIFAAGAYTIQVNAHSQTISI